MAARQRHTLVIYRAGKRADRALGTLARHVEESGGRLTVLALALEEAVDRQCCDTRSVLWNRYVREFAQEDLARARLVVDGTADAELAVLVHRGPRAAAAVAEEAQRRGADEVILADPGSCGLTRRERRRLLRLRTSVAMPGAG